jgi:acyl-CoA synthetase (AMP-forming)/AMP-acid ligase II
MDFLIHHMLRTSAHHWAEKEALVHGDQRFSYREVARRSSGLAEGLRRAGLLRGDRIGIYLDPSIAQVISIFGTSEAGGVFVPINATLFPEQVGHIAKDCGMKGLITTAAKLSTLTALLHQIPTLEFVVLTGEGDTPQMVIPAHRLEEFYELSSPPGRREQAISKDLAAILYTS